MNRKSINLALQIKKNQSLFDKLCYKRNMNQTSSTQKNQKLYSTNPQNKREHTNSSSKNNKIITDLRNEFVKIRKEHSRSKEKEDKEKFNISENITQQEIISTNQTNNVFIPQKFKKRSRMKAHNALNWNTEFSNSNANMTNYNNFKSNVNKEQTNTNFYNNITTINTMFSPSNFRSKNSRKKLTYQNSQNNSQITKKIIKEKIINENKEPKVISGYKIKRIPQMNLSNINKKQPKNDTSVMNIYYTKKEKNINEDNLYIKEMKDNSEFISKFKSLVKNDANGDGSKSSRESRKKHDNLINFNERARTFNKHSYSNSFIKTKLQSNPEKFLLLQSPTDLQNKVHSNSPNIFKQRNFTYENIENEIIDKKITSGNLNLYMTNINYENIPTNSGAKTGSQIQNKFRNKIKNAFRNHSNHSISNNSGIQSSFLAGQKNYSTKQIPIKNLNNTTENTIIKKSKKLSATMTNFTHFNMTIEANEPETKCYKNTIKFLLKYIRSLKNSVFNKVSGFVKKFVSSEIKNQIHKEKQIIDKLIEENSKLKNMIVNIILKIRENYFEELKNKTKFLKISKELLTENKYLRDLCHHKFIKEQYMNTSNSFKTRNTAEFNVAQSSNDLLNNSPNVTMLDINFEDAQISTSNFDIKNNINNNIFNNDLEFLSKNKKKSNSKDRYIETNGNNLNTNSTSETTLSQKIKQNRRRDNTIEHVKRNNYKNNSFSEKKNTKGSDVDELGVFMKNSLNFKKVLKKKT